MRKLIILCLNLFFIGALVSCSTSNIFTSESSMQTASYTPRGEVSLWQGNPPTVWNNLQMVPRSELQAKLTQTQDPNQIAWLKLALLSKQYSTDTPQLVQALMAWRAEYPNHVGNTLFADNGTLSSLSSPNPPRRVALLLPLQGRYGNMGHSLRDGFLNAYYQSPTKTVVPQKISFYDTDQKNPSAVYQQAVSEGADFVVGPLLKENVQALISGSSISVPTLALNYTDSSLPSNLYEFGLSPQDEASQLADKAKLAGHTRAIIIAPQGDWGSRIVRTTASRWQEEGGVITETFYYSPQSNLSQEIPRLLHANPIVDNGKQKENNKQVLERQRRQDFDVIFLIAYPQYARQIVPLLRYYYADNIPIYATSVVYSGTPSPQRDSDLNGVMFNDIPWVLGHKPVAAQSGAESNRLFAVGRDAYLLSANLPRLIKLPNFPIYASTGALTLTSRNQIYRRLPWTKMQSGHP